MPNWKKVLTEDPIESDLASDSPAGAGEVLTSTGSGSGVPVWAPVSSGSSTLADLTDTAFTGTTTDGVDKAAATNDTLIYDGTDWVAVPAGTTFNFDILTFVSPDVVENGTVLQGTEGASFQSSMNFTATYTNLSGNLDSAGSVAISEDTHGSQSGFPLSMGADGSASGNVDLLYPTDGMDGSNSSNELKFTLSATEGGVAKTKNFSVFFKNYKYYGIDPSATLDGTGTSSGDVRGLTSGNLTTFATDYLLNTTTGLDGTGYIHYLYPARITGTPTFWISGLAVDFTLESSSLSVTNSAGFAENYKHYRSPQSYTSGSNSLQVT